MYSGGYHTEAFRYAKCYTHGTRYVPGMSFSMMALHDGAEVACDRVLSILISHSVHVTIASAWFGPCALWTTAKWDTASSGCFALDGVGRLRSGIDRWRKATAVVHDDTAVVVVDPSADGTVARVFGEIVEEDAASVAGEITAQIRNRATDKLSRVTKDSTKPRISETQGARKWVGFSAYDSLLRSRHGLPSWSRILRGFEGPTSVRASRPRMGGFLFPIANELQYLIQIFLPIVFSDYTVVMKGNYASRRLS